MKRFSLQQLTPAATCAWLLFASSTAFAQVNGNGVSDSALFDTVINVPTDPNIGKSQSIGGVAGETTQLNLFNGGSIGSSFDVNSGAELNIFGGSTAFTVDALANAEVNILGGDIFGLNALPGSQLNISGGVIRSRSRILAEGAEVNITGGNIAAALFASGTTANLSGGHFDSLTASIGSDVNISGGSFGSLFGNRPSGTSIEGAVEFIGGEFQLNRNAITDSTISFTEGDVLTGTLQDGSVFIHGGFDFVPSLNFISVSSGNPLPTIDTTPIVVSTPLSAGPSGLREGQTLTLQNSAFVDNFRAVDATLNVSGAGPSGGGQVLEGAEVSGSTVNISGGTVFDNFRGHNNSVINISGGTVGEGFEVRSGSTANISGGTVGLTQVFSGSTFNLSSGEVESLIAEERGIVNVSGGNITDLLFAFRDSEVNISGGSLRRLQANPGGIANISGGNFESIDFFGSGTISGGSFGRFFVGTGNEVSISGGEFLLNGSVINDISSPFTLSDGDVFTGTLEDGSSFIFSTLDSDSLNGVSLIEASTPTIDTTPQTINTASTLRSIRAGQTLTVQSGGVLENNFAAVDATFNVDNGSVGNFVEVARSEVNISNGTVGNDFIAFNSTVNISEGTVGSRFEALTDSTINISGGSVGVLFAANDGSTVNISEGTIGSGFDANDGSTVNISGGTVGIRFEANGSTVNISGGSVGDTFEANGSIVNISGGSVGDTFDASDGSTINFSGGSIGDRFDVRSSTVNVFGTEFFLNGDPLDDLTLNQSFTIFDRGQGLILSGLLADGTPFDFELNDSFFIPSSDQFLTDSTLTVTLVATAVPEPGCGLTLAAMSILLLTRRRALR